MQSCDACLQIYTLSKEENKLFGDHSPHRFVPDDAWLQFEFGIAKQRDIPVWRMIDTSNVSKKLWEEHLRIFRDALLFEFKKDILPVTTSKSFVDQLNIVVQNIIKDLNTRHRGH